MSTRVHEDADDLYAEREAMKPAAQMNRYTPIATDTPEGFAMALLDDGQYVHIKDVESHLDALEALTLYTYGPGNGDVCPSALEQQCRTLLQSAGRMK